MQNAAQEPTRAQRRRPKTRGNMSGSRVDRAAR